MTLKPGHTYICPKCKLIMQPHKGPYDMYHCILCQQTIDLWRDPEPEQIEAPERESYDPYARVVVYRVHQKPKSAWQRFIGIFKRSS